MRFLLVVAVTIFCTSAMAEPLSKIISKEQLAEMASANAATAAFEAEWKSLFKDDNPLTMDLLATTQSHPIPEYDKAGYLIFSSEFRFDSKAAKLKMAEELPADMTLVIFTHSNLKSHIKNIRTEYDGLIAEDRLKVVYIPQSNRGFWTRDGVPVPVWRQEKGGQKKFAVVDARYYHNFEQDQDFANMFSAGLTEHNYYYEGGNFMTNSRGECVVVNNSTTQQMPDQLFLDHYGCTSVMRMPFVKGIGHIDESAKFMDDDTIITDTQSYVKDFEDAGYNVIMLPRPNNGYETYVNSLIVNGTVYVPVFQQDNDEKALKVYEDLGLKAVPLDSIELSNFGAGSIHCITMTYPPVEFTELLEAIDAQPIH